MAVCQTRYRTASHLIVATVSSMHALYRYICCGAPSIMVFMWWFYMPHSCGSAASCASMQVGHSTGQVVVHVVPNNSHVPQSGFPAVPGMPVATIGTAIPPCHSSVICLSARCLHACDLESHRSEAMGEGGAEPAPRAAVDTGGARVLTVRRMRPLYLA